MKRHFRSESVQEVSSRDSWGNTQISFNKKSLPPISQKFKAKFDANVNRHKGWSTPLAHPSIFQDSLADSSEASVIRFFVQENASSQHSSIRKLIRSMQPVNTGDNDISGDFQFNKTFMHTLKSSNRQKLVEMFDKFETKPEINIKDINALKQEIGELNKFFQEFQGILKEYKSGVYNGIIKFIQRIFVVLSLSIEFFADKEVEIFVQRKQNTQVINKLNEEISQLKQQYFKEAQERENQNKKIKAEIDDMFYSEDDYTTFRNHCLKQIDAEDSSTVECLKDLYVALQKGITIPQNIKESPMTPDELKRFLEQNLKQLSNRTFHKATAFRVAKLILSNRPQELEKECQTDFDFLTADDAEQLQVSVKQLEQQVEQYQTKVQHLEKKCQEHEIQNNKLIIEKELLQAQNLQAQSIQQKSLLQQYQLAQQSQQAYNTEIKNQQAELQKKLLKQKRNKGKLNNLNQDQEQSQILKTSGSRNSDSSDMQSHQSSLVDHHTTHETQEDDIPSPKRKTTKFKKSIAKHRDKPKITNLNQDDYVARRQTESNVFDDLEYRPRKRDGSNQRKVSLENPVQIPEQNSIQLLQNNQKAQSQIYAKNPANIPITLPKPMVSHPEVQENQAVIPTDINALADIHLNSPKAESFYPETESQTYILPSGQELTVFHRGVTTINSLEWLNIHKNSKSTQVAEELLFQHNRPSISSPEKVYNFPYNPNAIFGLQADIYYQKGSFVPKSQQSLLHRDVYKLGQYSVQSINQLKISENPISRALGISKRLTAKSKLQKCSHGPPFKIQNAHMSYRTYDLLLQSPRSLTQSQRQVRECVTIIISSPPLLSNKMKDCKVQ